jgi:hypothetical protein
MAMAIGLIAALLIASAAGGETTHTYPVTVTIRAERAAHRLSGEVSSPAPSEFCTTSAVRVMRVARGKDTLVGRLEPNALSEWHMKSRKALRGARVYAETLPYHLPSRPVVCERGRSRAVRAP